MKQLEFDFDKPIQEETISVTLPGPTRKRTATPYFYRVTYFSPDSQEAGCAMACEVCGGRMVYQVALERQENGTLRWHCTCADWIYRGEMQGRLCKHVKGLLALGRRD